MIKHITLLFILLISQISYGQSGFEDSTKEYFKGYVNGHDVVKGDDRNNLDFYAPDRKFRVIAQFERVENGAWFEMPTTGQMKKLFRVFGKIRFKIHDTAIQLNVYQSQNLMGLDKYKNHLFLPFTDKTTGVETYSGGRYIDLDLRDIVNNTILIDFNKAYNPYCAYVTGKYNCPVPPRENAMTVAVRSGEKAYGKH